MTRPLITILNNGYFDCSISKKRSQLHERWFRQCQVSRFINTDNDASLSLSLFLLPSIEARTEHEVASMGLRLQGADFPDVESKTLVETSCQVDMIDF